MNIKRIALLILSILALIVSVFWWLDEQGQDYESVLAFIAGVFGLIEFFAERKQQDTPVESLDQRNRRVMLDHVENFWVKGVLENSLHGAALLELGIKVSSGAVRSYPWTIKKEPTNEILPAGKPILEIFKEIGVGRSLLILGAPGSGKTTMLLELTRQFIARARNDESEPIPVVFNLASWREKQTLADWLAEQLNIVYFVPKKVAPMWVSGNKMLLLLDGLDEVRGDRRWKCVETINQFRIEYGFTSLAVCCRIEEYKVISAKLYFEGAITLQPLTSKQVSDYFDTFGTSLAGVQKLLQSDKALQILAKTPLTLSIMALAYKDKKTEELLPTRIREAQHKQLFDAYVHRMFEHSTGRARSMFTKSQTLHYLCWLARRMSQYNLVTYQIEAMQPTWLETWKQRRFYKWVIGLIVGLIVVISGGLIFGLMDMLFGSLIAGPIGGLMGMLSVVLIFGLGGGLLVGLSEEISMVDRLRWSWEERQGQLFSGLILGLIFGLIGGMGVGLIGALILGLGGGLLVGLIFGLSGEQIEETNYPGQRLKQTLYSAISIILIGGLTFGLIFGLLGGLIFGLSVGLIVALIAGLSHGFAYGGGALIQHYTLRYFLVKNGALPRLLIPFLEHAVDLIFLRRVGGSYIFVHRLLMQHFAEMDA